MVLLRKVNHTNGWAGPYYYYSILHKEYQEGSKYIGDITICHLKRMLVVDRRT
jgi:hypothetical protein